MLYDMCMPVCASWTFCCEQYMVASYNTTFTCSGLQNAEECPASSSVIKRHKHTSHLLVSAGMKKLISSCPALGVRPEFRGIMNLKGLDVISTRLWLDQSLPTRFPANVLAGFEPGVGGTYFNLTELQVCPLTSQATGAFKFISSALPEICVCVKGCHQDLCT